MEYINYPKQSPVQGLTGLYGGVQGSLMAAAGGSFLWYGDRGTFGGGYHPNKNVIDYITITSTGNAQDFGDLAMGTARSSAPAAGGGRGLYMGGRSTGNGNDQQMDYITFATTGNATDFGDSSLAGKGYAAGASDGSRALVAGGNGTSGTDQVRYVTISTPGDSTDLANLVGDGFFGLAGCSNGTRAVFSGGYAGSQGGMTDIIQYKNIQDTGNCSDFGDLTVARRYIGAGQNAAGRGFITGGDGYNNVNYINIASTGNAQVFGNFSGHDSAPCATSNATRGIIAGNYPTDNQITYMTIATTSDGSNFGDLTVARGYSAGTSGD